MNFNPENKSPKKEKKVFVSKIEQYNDLIQDFGMFITLNAAKIEQQLKPGYEEQLKELRVALRAPIINGLNYADFISKHWKELNEPVTSTALVKQIFGFLNYLQPRMDFFQDDSAWKKRFEEVSTKYSDFIKTL